MTAVASASVDALDPVDLVELNARAALLTRVDRKYLLDEAAVARFLDALGAGVRALDIDGRRSFGYASTYYDDACLTAFHTAAHRRRRRGKVRSRTYLDSGDRFLEVKTRRGGVTVKERLAWPCPSERLEGAGLAFARSKLAAAGIEPGAPLRPVLDVTYCRQTLLLADGRGRVTLDRGLVWTDRRDGARVWAPGLCVVETKSGARPSPADAILWRLGQRPAALSKYATGLAVLRPELPRNRWQRVLHDSPLTRLDRTPQVRASAPPTGESS